MFQLVSMQMGKYYISFIYLVIMACVANVTNGQQIKKQLVTNTITDTAVTVKQIANNGKDSLVLKQKHNPRIATRRSAIIPGWGQAYNKEYWKIPIVYGLIAIPVSLFFYNDKWYKKTRDAFDIKINRDTARFPEIDPLLVNLSVNSLQNYRNSFRQGRDYAVIFTLLAWGVNVIDATVFEHLKQFDVSDELSLRIKPSISPINLSPTLGVVISQKNKSDKQRIQVK